MKEEESLHPSTAARYEAVKLLGRGGMGSVWLARDRELQREVALKIVSRNLIRDTSAMARFAREARLQAQIDHPHVIKIYDFALDSEQPYLAMEVVQGRDLEEILRDGGPLPAARVVDILAELADAVDTLHESSILHRDLKPSNVMIRSRDQSAVVMDLGLAFATDATVLTATGQFVGTPRYMPPEVAGDRGWCEASDQWQLAAIAFEALTAKHLVPGSSLEEVFGNIALGTWTPIPEDVEVPAPLREAVGRAADIEPEDRFPDCRSFARAAAGEREPEDSPEVPDPSGAFSAAVTHSGLERPGAGRRRTLPLLAAGLALGALGLGWLLGSVPPTEVRWQVVGDSLLVRFRGDEGTRLEIDDRTVMPDCDEAGDCRALAPGLPANRSVRARLVWDGGASPRTELRAEPPAVRARPRLGEERTLRVQVLRPCRLRILESGARPRSYRAGVVHLDVPEGPARDLRLEWEEEGLRFERIVPWSEVLELAAEEILGFQDREGYRALMVDLLNGRASPGALGDDRRAWRELEGWIPELLRSGLPVATRWGIYARHEAWRRAAFVSRIFRRTRPARELPPDSPGARRFARGDLPETLDLGPLLRPDQGDDHMPERHRYILEMRHRIKIVGDVDSASGAYTLSFPWPEGVPRDDRPLQLGMRVSNFEEPGEARLVAADGTHPFAVHFWHPDPRPSINVDYVGWTTVTLTGSMAPPPGTPMELTYEPLYRELGGDFYVDRLELRW